MDRSHTRSWSLPRRCLPWAVAGLLLAVAACARQPGGEDVASPGAMEVEAMERMLNEIERDTRETVSYTGRSTLSPRVLEAIRAVRRPAFVPREDSDKAYLNRPLPIGSGQTISQPFIVALMSDVADIEDGERVLEVGTGSGYQAAVLAELTDEVYSIEIIPELAERARAVLDAEGYEKVQTRVGDGYHGWAEQAPFDAILVTAAAAEIPPPLLAQLAAGGRLVIPIKESAFSEQLTLVIRRQDGGLESRELLPVRFVPLTGDH